MRKRLDGGVHQGGCSGLGLGALESFMGGAGIKLLFLCRKSMVPGFIELLPHHC